MIKTVSAILMFGLLPSLAIARSETPGAPDRPEEMAYGSATLQRIDFWRGSKDAPLLVFLHGGGWSGGDKADELASPKIKHFRARGFALATVNYRLVPEVPVADQVQDAADAVGYLAAHGDRLGIAPRKIVLMGHSSGGHLAALLGTDPTFLQKAAVDISAISGVILIDGAGLAPNAHAAPRSGGPFGSEENRQRLAPINHVAPPNARSFLMLNARSEDLRQQAMALSNALIENGTRASTHPIADTDHMALNRNLGSEGDEATRLIDAYLAAISHSSGPKE